MNRPLFFVGAAAIVAMATAASAHTHLTGSDPAANATVAAPRQLTLHFSEKLNPRFSGVTVTMAQMNNMAVATKVSVAQDGKTLIATPKQPLSAGAYTVSWRAVSADTHRMQGSYSFTVR